MDVCFNKSWDIEKGKGGECFRLILRYLEYLINLNILCFKGCDYIFNFIF